MFIWQGRVQISKAARRQRATWQPLMSGRFRAVNEIRGRDCGVSLERVTHTRAVQYGTPWVTGGIIYSTGRGCNGVSYAFLQCGYNRGFTLAGGCMQNSFCRFGKISSGFCNQAFHQYGCKRAFTSFWGCMLGSSCRFGKISLGFGNHASLSI